MIVARLIQFGKLGGFHFNDSKYGDDDLDAGSINPFQLFLVFNELVDAADRKALDVAPAYMLDQSHNVTDPVESLMSSAMELQRRYAQALPDRPGAAGAGAGRERCADGAGHAEGRLQHRRLADPRHGARIAAAAPSIRSASIAGPAIAATRQNERPAQSKQSAGIV